MRPLVRLGRRVDRIPARLAERRAAANHGQLGQPLSRTGEAVPLGDVGRRVRAAEKVSAVPTSNRFASIDLFIDSRTCREIF